MINPIYLNKRIIKEKQQEFKRAYVLKLENFYMYPEKIEKEIKKIKFQKRYLPTEYSFEEGNKLPIDEKELKRFLSLFFKREIKLTIKRYYHKDYTLLNDKEKKKDGICIIDFTKEWKKEAGGYTSFIKDDNEVIRVYPEYNVCTLIKSKNKKSFVKYINCLSKKKRVLVEGEI